MAFRAAPLPFGSRWMRHFLCPPLCPDEERQRPCRPVRVRAVGPEQRPVALTSSPSRPSVTIASAQGIGHSPACTRHGGTRHGEVIRGYAHALQPFRVAGSGQVDAPAERGRDSGQRAGGGPDVGEVGQRQRLTIGARTHDGERDEPVGIDERQRPQHDCVHQREHRGDRADRQREDAHDAPRERGLAGEASQDLQQFREAHDRRLRQIGRIMKLIVRINSMNSAHA